MKEVLLPADELGTKFIFLLALNLGVWPPTFPPRNDFPVGLFNPALAIGFVPGVVVVVVEPAVGLRTPASLCLFS